MANNRKWGDPELAILRTHYTKRGARYVQKRLKEEGYERSVPAIWAKAQEAFLYRGHTRGYVPLAWVAKYPNGLGLYQLLKRAKRDGALHDSGNPNDRVRYMVKESWADDVIRERIQGEQ